MWHLGEETSSRMDVVVVRLAKVRGADGTIAVTCTLVRLNRDNGSNVSVAFLCSAFVRRLIRFFEPSVECVRTAGLGGRNISQVLNNQLSFQGPCMSGIVLCSWGI
jgi:hypothetical protein